MSKKTYAEKLKDPRWQKLRLEILERDNWTCTYCKDTKSTLHVHHLKYAKEPWEAMTGWLITLCDKCHEVESKKRPASEQELLRGLELGGWSERDLSYMAFIFEWLSERKAQCQVLHILWALKDDDFREVVSKLCNYHDDMNEKLKKERIKDLPF